MARELQLLNVLRVKVPQEAFEDLLIASEKKGLAWHQAVARLEQETQEAAREFVLKRIAEWKDLTPDPSPTGRGEQER